MCGRRVNSNIKMSHLRALITCALAASPALVAAHDQHADLIQKYMDVGLLTSPESDGGSSNGGGGCMIDAG